MIQPSPTPVPDHGTGWGLLMLFAFLFVIVALLGALTGLSLAMRYFNKRFPKPLAYFSVLLLVGAAAISGFMMLVAARAQRYDVLGLIVFIVFLPLTYVIAKRIQIDPDSLTVIRQAALAWSLPFLTGFGVIAFTGTLFSGIPQMVTGIVAGFIVNTGTVFSERWLRVHDIE